jgi:hypothetical protein
VGVENIGFEIVENGLELLFDIEIPLLLELLHTPLLRRILRPVLKPEIVVVEHAVNGDAVAHRFRFGLPLYAGGADSMSHGDEFLGEMFDRAFASTNDMRRIKAAKMENSHADTLYFPTSKIYGVHPGLGRLRKFPETSETSAKYKEPERN